MNKQHKQFRCMVVWEETCKTHSLMTDDLHAAMKAAQAVSNDLKDECFCIIRESNCGDRWNVSETVVFRSGLRI